MSRKQQATDKVNKKKRITKIPFSTTKSKGENMSMKQQAIDNVNRKK